VGSEEVVLARRVWAEGRTRAYLNGRSATAADLQEIGGALLTFYGQHEHRRLTLASAQLTILDGFCGPAHAARLSSFAQAYAAERALAAELEELRERAGARDRELDLLEWELAEIEAASPSEEEEASLLAEREKLRHATALAGGVGAALAALDGGGAPGDDGDFGAGTGYGGAAGVRSGAAGGFGAAPAGGALAALAAGARGLETVAGVDPVLDELAARVSTLTLEADDLAAEFRRYAEGVDAPPGRLDAVEERLALLDRLKRKHGGTIAAVLAYGEQCRARRDTLAGAEEALADGTARLAAARDGLASEAGKLRKARRAAAKELAVAVVERLADLAMEGATFEARVEPRASGHGEGDGNYGPSGGDDVEFVIAPNPGVPAGPLREIASGGELSRVMLALMSVAAATAGAKVLVFDEIDAGIGGQTARAVGERLRDLGAGRQVIAITHLPQIASLAERHFRIAKDTEGETALTTVTALAKGEVVGELVRMLGADSDDVAARRHAKELLKAA
ncbi:MAG: repair protein RecN, partial [Solirubrobacteraceae bacterium]|nr:repair protein RecN [Solirubrobacteraceae bacterium]